MKDYIENRKKHLCKYAKENNIDVGGEYNYKGKIYSYDHILKNKDKKELNLIEELRLKDKPFDLIDKKKLHRFAHHLNSSQILCYNYFRPMITDNKEPKDELLRLISDNIISIKSNAICEFEYNPNTEEGTEFDFYIKQDEYTEIFFEIKYTEYQFGQAKNDERHKNKFEDIYKEMIDKCKCLKTKNIEFDVFIKNYQLFRNILRVTEENKFSIFLLPKEHERLRKSFETFKNDYVSKEYCNNVKVLYWEDLVKGKENTELFKKYFS